MVVGLVLCGKVVIDWGPAMLHAREGSIDSGLVEQMGNPVLQSMQDENIPLSKTHTERSFSRSTVNGDLGNCLRHPRIHGYNGDIGQEGAIDCIVYSQYDNPFNSNRGSLSHPQQIPNRSTHGYSLPEIDQSPQSPLGPLRGKIGMNRTSSQTTSSGAPVIKPHLINHSRATSPIYFTPKPQNYHLQQQYYHHHSHNQQQQPPSSSHQYLHYQQPQQSTNQRQRPIDASSSLLRAYPHPHYSPRTRSLGYEAECNCSVHPNNNTVFYRQPTSVDYGSVQQRETPITHESSQLYQGETFVLNERNYFI
uniref:Uncharacterized protein n=1 Tax=Panagrolaimus sp. ES5 TaxID=591445 RepID=A0AC34F4V0_9BILA